MGPVLGPWYRLPAVLNATSLRWLLAALVGWLDQRERQSVAYARVCER